MEDAILTNGISEQFFDAKTKYQKLRKPRVCAKGKAERCGGYHWKYLDQ